MDFPTLNSEITCARRYLSEEQSKSRPRERDPMFAGRRSQIHCRTPHPELEFGSTQADYAPIPRLFVVFST